MTSAASSSSFRSNSAPIGRLRDDAIVIACAAVIFISGILSPPSLMDDVDGAHAQIARNMLVSGDWVTPRLDGIPYFDKAPLHFWLIALSYRVFDVHDWAARIPLALSSIALCWVTARFAAWAFGRKAGLYAGLVLATCVGLFLFTRVLIPDAILTLLVTAAMWALLRALDPAEPHPRRWACVLAACIGTGLLVKGLVGVVVIFGGGCVYLLAARLFFVRDTWRRLHVWTGLAIVVGIAAPWHIAAMLRNAPLFDVTLHSAPREYRGFFWRYFINEHLLRFLNERYPRDYNTVPRLQFWLLHLVWLFPWSVFLPATVQNSYRPSNRAGRTRLLALCWTGFLLFFFTFSTTQEYYTMPCYPALALLLGSALAGESRWLRRGETLLLVIASAAAVVAGILFVRVWAVPRPGDISTALSANPQDYTLSLGHLHDLTLKSLAYLKLPLALAALACVIGTAGLAFRPRVRAVFSIAVMMIVLIEAARLALIAFDPALSSRPLARILARQPPGRLIVGDEYWAFSALLFYRDESPLIWRGRFNNLEYGSWAPGAAQVFIGDDAFRNLWSDSGPVYLLVMPENVRYAEQALGAGRLSLVAESGGKLLFRNRVVAY